MLYRRVYYYNNSIHVYSNTLRGLELTIFYFIWFSLSLFLSDSILFSTDRAKRFRYIIIIILLLLLLLVILLYTIHYDQATSCARPPAFIYCTHKLRAIIPGGVGGRRWKNGRLPKLYIL